MHHHATINDFLALPALLAVALASPATATVGPRAVSPGSPAGSTGVEARCPTFLWSGSAAAGGYELAVFRLDGNGGEPVLVTRASVPGDARGWTPSAGDCLERGERYAWSVAAAGEDPEWSAPFLFEIQQAPSLDEVAQAIATLERYQAHGTGSDRELDGTLPGALAAPTLGFTRALRADAPTPGGPSFGAVASIARSAANDQEPDAVALPGALVAPTSGITRIDSRAVAPTLGTPSLTVGANFALSAESNLFKEGSTFLWDDSDSNTAVGRRALGAASGTLAYSNTAVGRDALRQAQSANNTAVGVRALANSTSGFNNTAVGKEALLDNLNGRQNTAVGNAALQANLGGYSNVALGNNTLQSNLAGIRNIAVGMSALQASTGSRNIAIGHRAGYAIATGNDNIVIGTAVLGSSADSNTIRIGGGTGTGPGQQNRTYISGIRDWPTLPNDAIQVLISSTGQLGTINSSRALKQDIQDLGPIAARLLALRPVTFRYRQHAESHPDGPLEFGLIAEEVAQVFPELVVYNEDGRPQTVKYHLLSSLLLAELQRQHELVLEQGARLERLEEAQPADPRPRREPTGRRRGR